MQDVLIVSYLVSKEFDLLSRSIFDHSDDCADMCSARANVRFGPKADIGPYSITSLACASSAGGTVMPSAFAVLRLITNSYLVDACTGRSAGFSPLRIRST